MTQLLIYILAAHFIADFLCQTKWQATNKSSSFKALGAHIATYALVLFIALIQSFPLREVGMYVGANALLHFVTDAISSRVTAYAHKDYDNHRALFWGTIGADQFAHQAALILTLPLLR